MYLHIVLKTYESLEFMIYIYIYILILESIIFDKYTIIIDFGVSGDISKKSFPILFGLFRKGYVDSSTIIIGYVRSKMNKQDLINWSKSSTNNSWFLKRNSFFEMISYVSGG